MNKLTKIILGSIGIGLLILFAIVGISETIFGDLTQEDSYKPLLVAVPIIGVALGYLIYKTK